ncbi:DUF3137 domain-containing protein [Campylobacter sp. VBCF_05 NA6]|uniref:DUF3137 domain-containing protein n=1 Tax=unclassified Campylobacter TaxID=2593542 RepID=UPI0022E9BC0F|nr:MULTISPECIES: DUF3137 domain-containing protein [unclassified Campylobacter]MDA3056919.1 DUF3137 domain-containing protein [Campylobacter sp. VBCF_04 NA7]MDA3058687.1 DUF3137 domain-containing protein [Campylobacter sp. VBCF_05 NA6]
MHKPPKDNYNGISYETMQELEFERQRINKKLSYILYFSIFISFILTFLFGYFFDELGFIRTLILVLPIFLIVFSILYPLINSDVSNIKPKFKHAVIEKIVKDINPNFAYRPTSSIGEKEFFKPNLYNRAQETWWFKGDDFIDGRHNGVYFRMSDIDYYVLRSAGRSVYAKHLFLGIVFIAKFYKFFNSRVYIIRKNKDTGYTRNYGKKINIDNVEFSEQYDVYADDEISAFYILSHSFMEDFLNLAKRMKCEINAVFYRDNLYLYINNRRENFEIDFGISQTLIPIIYRTHKKMILEILKIIDDLNLNSKVFKPSLGGNSGENLSENS